LGGVLLVAGDLDGAERAFARLTESTPGEPWGPLGLGRVAQRRGSSAQAARHLERALAADPANAQTAYLLATAYREGGRSDEARALVARAREGVEPTGPADPILDRVRSAGRGLQRLVQGANQALAAGNAQAAEAIYLEVLRADADYYDALFNLGLLYGRQERFAESQAMLERAVEARPESSQARLLLALSLASQDRLEEARAQLRALLDRDPEHAEARAMLEEMDE
jgi:tetratricopeptide (TPR) repeat protein